MTPRLRTWIYRFATAWLVVELIGGGVVDLLRGRAMLLVAGEHVDLAVSMLGYPVYILFFLGVFKILGGVVISAPGLLRLKEWAYAGSFFQIFLAAASIALVGLDATELIYPVVVLVLTLVSWALRPPSRVLA